MRTTIFGSYVLVTLDLMSIAYVTLSIRPWLPHFSSDMVVRMPAVTVTLRGRSFKLFFFLSKFIWHMDLSFNWIHVHVHAVGGKSLLPFSKVTLCACARWSFFFALFAFSFVPYEVFCFPSSPNSSSFLIYSLFLHWCLPWSLRTRPLISSRRSSWLNTYK